MSILHPTQTYNPKEYADIKKKGRRFMLRGLIFLAIALVVSQIAGMYTNQFAQLISESAVIVGWVALWRPIEFYLYDLPEIRRHKEKKA